MDSFFEKLLSQPTAPFRERHTREACRMELEAHDVPHFVDPIGNLVVGAESKSTYLKLIRAKSPEPVRLFIAHLDHPGFHGVKLRGPMELEFKWHGGSPVDHVVGTPVWLGDESGWAGRGMIRDVSLASHGKAIDSGVIRLETSPGSSPERLYGGFRFRSPLWIEGQLAYTKAADDLVGAWAIVSTAKELFGKRRGRKEVPMLGLLSRAEEVGFIGTIGHLELGWWKKARRPLLCVSLETSRQLPNAEIGKGPVVRLGDRATVFSSGPLRAFSQLAETTLPGKHQRRIMDGGTCEATAALAYGIPAIGISVPLGNYHNQGFEGGPDCRGPNGPAPEYVHLEDARGMLALCQAVMRPKIRWDDAWKTRVGEFKTSLRKYRPLLNSL